MITSVFITSLLFSLAANAKRVARSNGCGKQIPDGLKLDQSKNLNITSQSAPSITSTREYRIHLPSSYKIDVTVPLIISFHGRTKNMTEQEGLSQFSNSSYGFEGIAVYPQGLESDKGTPQWQGDPDSHGVDDVKFTLELIDEISNNFCIDPSRIYANGKSNGAGFTGLLACDPTATEKIAAFAAVSLAYYLDADNKPPACNPTTKRQSIPILETHGWVDKTIFYKGGPNTRGNANTTSIRKWVDDWAKRDGFQKNANQTSFLCSGNKLVTKYDWDETVVHYNYTNLQHDWPSLYPNDDTDSRFTCEQAEATPIILKWFAGWSL